MLVSSVASAAQAASKAHGKYYRKPKTGGGLLAPKTDKRAEKTGRLRERAMAATEAGKIKKAARLNARVEKRSPKPSTALGRAPRKVLLRKKVEQTEGASK